MTPGEVLTMALVDWYALRMARAWRDGKPEVVQEIREQALGNYGAEALEIIDSCVPDMYLSIAINECRK